MRNNLFGELISMPTIIGDLKLYAGDHDRRSWKLDPSDHFSVKNISSLVQEKHLALRNVGKHHVSNNWVPM